MHNLFKNCKVVQVSTTVAAGTTDIEPSAVDVAGFDGVAFLFSFGAITTNAVTSVKAQTSTDNSSFADLAGTAQTVADTNDDKSFVMDIYQPLERYIKPVVDRGTANAVLNCIFAILYNGRLAPPSHDSSVVGAEYHVSPARGTA